MRPEPEPFRRVDVRRDDGITYAGKLARPAFFLDDIHATGRAVARAVEDGLFVREEDADFDHVEHYDSVGAWKACLAKPTVGELHADERLVDSACALMGEGRAAIILTGRDEAARFRKRA